MGRPYGGLRQLLSNFRENLSLSFLTVGMKAAEPLSREEEFTMPKSHKPCPLEFSTGWSKRCALGRVRTSWRRVSSQRRTRSATGLPERRDDGRRRDGLTTEEHEELRRAAALALERTPAGSQALQRIGAFGMHECVPGFARRVLAAEEIRRRVRRRGRRTGGWDPLVHCLLRLVGGPTASRGRE